jgi:hypothetical protein
MNHPLSLWRLAYWLVAGPTGLLLVAWAYRRRRIGTGTGGGRGSYARAALVLVVAFALILPLWVIPLPTICAVLMVLAFRQDNAYLALCSICLGVITGLEVFGVFDNLLYSTAHALGMFKTQDGYFTGAPAVVYALTGILILAAGLIALTLERRLSRG